MEQKLPTEQLLSRGRQAARLLGDVTLMSFIDEIKGDLLSCIGSTQPEHHQERNLLYYQFNGLKMLLETLRQYANAAEMIEQSDQETVSSKDTD